MQCKIHGDGDRKIAEIVSDSTVIAKVQDALDLMANPALAGARKIILRKENIAPEFFDLRTGLAGEILQKFVNYHVQLAIVGDFQDVSSDSLKAFIAESNRGRDVFFVGDVETAVNEMMLND